MKVNFNSWESNEQIISNYLDRACLTSLIVYLKLRIKLLITEPVAEIYLANTFTPVALTGI